MCVVVERNDNLLVVSSYVFSIKNKLGYEINSCLWDYIEWVRLIFDRL